MYDRHNYHMNSTSRVTGVFTTKNYILIADTCQQLWIMGNNTNCCIKNNETLKFVEKPTLLPFQLEIKESVDKFFGSDYYLAILTTYGKLWMAITRKSIRNISGMNECENQYEIARHIITFNNQPAEIEILPTISKEARSNRNSRGRRGGRNRHQSSESSDSEMYSSDNSDFDNGDGRHSGTGQYIKYGNNGSEPPNLSLYLARSQSQAEIDADVELSSKKNPQPMIAKNIPIECDNYKPTTDCNINPTKKGFFFLSDNVTNVVFSTANMYFETTAGKVYRVSCFSFNTRIFLPNIRYVPNETREMAEMICCQPYSWYYGKGFLYQKQDDTHLILMSQGALNPHKNYISFQSSLKFSANDIYAIPHEESVYVVMPDAIYKFSHYHRCLIRIRDRKPNDKIIINDKNYAPGIMYYIDNENWYVDLGNWLTIGTIDKYIMKSVAIHSVGDRYFVFHDRGEDIDRNKFRSNSLYLHIKHYQQFTFTAQGIVVQRKTGELQIICVKAIKKPGNFHLTRKIGKKGYKFYVYEYSEQPQDIQSVTLDVMLVIQTDRQIWWNVTTLNSTTQFRELPLGSSDVTINMDCIVYPRHNDIGTKTINIQQSAQDKFSRFLQVLEFYNSNKNKHIVFKYVNIDRDISYGHGPTNAFIDDAMCQFADKYYVRETRHEFCPRFDYHRMAMLQDFELYLIGKALYQAINILGSNLPIRLPLLLQAAIQARHPTLLELEYFASNQNPAIYQGIAEKKHDPQQIAALGMGSYDKILQLICYYDVHDERVYHIVNMIKHGFYHKLDITKLSQQNFATFAYWLSGSFVIDIPRFLNEVKYNFMDDNEYYDVDIAKIYRLEFCEMVQNFTQSEMRTLLKNWSGYSNIKSDKVYQVDISQKTDKQTIRFVTCETHIYISSIYFMEENKPQLKIILTTEQDYNTL